jgi:hypothetical protein
MLPFLDSTLSRSSAFCEWVSGGGVRGEPTHEKASPPGLHAQKKPVPVLMPAADAATGGAHPALRLLLLLRACATPTPWRSLLCIVALTCFIVIVADAVLPTPRLCLFETVEQALQ